MTKEEKDLLFKDLCARLPYGVVIHTDWKDIKLDRDYCYIGMLYYEHYSEEAKKECGYNENDCSIIISGCYYGDIKPYLRPISSMTDEEKHKLLKFGAITCLKNGEVIDVSCVGFEIHADVQDYLNAHHFDYRGLIPKGLAIEVTEGNNPYKD